jgi:hypothetical protein
VAGDDLEAPLGLDNDAGKSRRLPFNLPFKLPSKLPVNLPAKLRLPAKIPLGMPIAALLVLCLAGFAGWALIVDDPLGGEPSVVLSTRSDPSPAARSDADGKPGPAGKDAPSAAEAAPAAGQPAAPTKTAAAGPTVTIIDGTSGKRQEISLPAAESQRAESIDTRLLETTRHGPVPRVSLDGARPSAAYARAASASKPQAAKVALVITGLGTSASQTAEAFKKLPGAVTFAFAPYAADIERLVARARGEGHEVLLQIPMEPFDYPDNDPGPQTLLTSLAPEQNVDRMHWLMSRFQGYVGLINAMGARFTATETAIAPVLRETAKRGLIYVDDGSSPRSLAGQIAGANNLPFAKAHVVLDLVPARAEVERALARLETVAREDGVAIGVASPLPLAVDLIAQWAKAAESRGFVLMPISAVAAKAKGS